MPRRGEHPLLTGISIIGIRRDKIIIYYVYAWWVGGGGGYIGFSRLEVRAGNPSLQFCLLFCKIHFHSIMLLLDHKKCLFLSLKLHLN